MTSICSISGGKSSAYLAANFHADHLVFALVRTENKKDLFPDPVLRKRVEDRTGKPFIATAEDNTIIHTIFDLEQFLGRAVNWVSGDTFEQMLNTRAGTLPGIYRRFCTAYLKVEPIFQWCRNQEFKLPITGQIGFRCEEKRRVSQIKKKTNANGILEHRAIIGKWDTGPNKGKNKWKTLEWEIPVFPLFANGVFHRHIKDYWRGKSVRFAPFNNCIHCFNKEPHLLRLMFTRHPEKMNWANYQEKSRKGTWKEGFTYQAISQMSNRSNLSVSDFGSCDSGYCGV